MNIADILQRAIALHQAGQLDQAEKLYSQILSQQPDHSDSIHLSGLIAHQRGDSITAVRLIERAIELNSSVPNYFDNLGLIFESMQLPENAAAAYRRSLALNPSAHGIRTNLANLLHRLGRFDEATAEYHVLLKHDPHSADMHNNLALCLQSLGQIDSALAAMQSAERIKPDSPEIQNNLGQLLLRLRRYEPAIEHFRKSLALWPDFVMARNNLASVFQEQGQLDAAQVEYESALTRDPNNADTLSNLAHLQQDFGQVETAIETYRRAVALAPNRSELHSNLLLALLCHPTMDGPAMLREHRAWDAAHAEPLRAKIRPLNSDRDPDRKLRIGYVSPDFKSHPVGRFIEPLLEHHDRSKFEVFCYSNVLIPDSTTHKLSTRADHWRNITGVSDDDVAGMIRADRIDVLIDLSLHGGGNRLLVFAQKPAPVQATYLAYAGTSGMCAMDFRITDPFLDPPGQNDASYSERSVHLPQSYWCYRAPGGAPPVAELPAKSAGRITFGCLNNFTKVSDDALETWRQILANVPDSRLILHAKQGAHRARVAEMFNTAGIAPSRVEFVSWLPIQTYFELYSRIDIALDPFPYAGGTTTCDALYMGVPVITLAGRLGFQRGGVSLLSNIKLPELIADSPADYIRIACDLVRDIQRLTALRAALRPRLTQSPMMDEAQFAFHFERILQEIWQK